jgi:hypothetical protein
MSLKKETKCDRKKREIEKKIICTRISFYSRVDKFRRR